MKKEFTKITPVGELNSPNSVPRLPTSERKEGGFSTKIRNEIKACIVREGMTMSEVVERLAEEYGWSRSVPNLSGKLRRGSLRYSEAIELADVLGYDLVWQKRK